MSSSNKKTHEESAMKLLVALGSAKPSKVGNSWKITIPKDVADKWNLSEEIDDDRRLYQYLATFNGKKCLLITYSMLPLDPFQDDEGWD